MTPSVIQHVLHILSQSTTKLICPCERSKLKTSCAVTRGLPVRTKWLFSDRFKTQKLKAKVRAKQHNLLTY